MAPRPRSTQTKSAYAAKQLRDALGAGKYASGQWLRAQDLADEFGLSLTPVREALLELASEGLVDIIPFRGARVSEIPMVDLSEVYAARGLLEAAATSLAAARITPKALAEVRALHDAFVTAVKTGKRDELRELNDRFHFAIYQAAGAPLISQLIKTVWTRSPRDTFRLLPDRPERSVKAHADIVEALGRRDPRDAERAMREHIDESFALIRSYRKDLGPNRRIGPSGVAPASARKRIARA
jgi:DNA-binding GntR family transcriptional regulator